MSDSATPWTVDHQAPQSMGFSMQEYWNGLSCPPPGDLPDPEIEPESLMSLALTSGFFKPTKPSGKPHNDGIPRHKRLRTCVLPVVSEGSESTPCLPPM